MNQLYEEFHSVTKPHSHIITENDFTHGKIVNLIKPFLRNTQKVLNIGCGTGSLDFFIARENIKVTGIDISQRAIISCIRTAKSFNLVKSTKFIQSDLERFKTEDKFDMILLIEVIEHLPNDLKALKKIFGLLNNKGIFILSTPSLNAPLYKLGLLKKFDSRVGHLRRYDMEGISSLLKKANFEIIYTEKAEGLIRNYLFTSFLGGVLLLKLTNKFSFFKRIILFLDEISLKLFGESDLILIARKK